MCVLFQDNIIKRGLKMCMYQIFVKDVARKGVESGVVELVKNGTLNGLNM